MKMEELKKIEDKIEYLRKCLHESIDNNESLLVKQVIFLSQQLDEVLNEYNNIKNELNMGFGI
ncbi:Spo0E like sporulation regulatory protein [Caminicella sporogenes DSM 14501]|uniref:Spo0E like sporulation regulatory protein n=1 Tax=Caminicella sporogenes DSM 14501 TaxID=1121266 RepID=A0A1M6NL31_9FIRM|nr:aspartyl-phosphate phosphatase Spo0E family protein [Caminicella sporogenes]SHJ96264.1 Spo0E like sporulation regulatory protein [Caminicella sporogenes DSM 14501]